MSEEAKHTSAPWRLHDYGPDSGNVIRFEVHSERGMICEIEDPDLVSDQISKSEASANACLIVAAPDLLAALTQISEQLECPARNTTRSSRRDGSVIISSDVRAAVKAAIARARP